MANPARPSPLPWLAAAVALSLGLAIFLATVLLRHGLAALDERARAMAYAAALGNLTFRAGMAFLVAQWHGERHGRLAFRRPALVLALFALFLLGWQVLQIELIDGVLRLVAAASLTRLALVALPFAYPLLHAVSTWLAWVLATWIMRGDALPRPPANVRWRAAGLMTWLLASALLICMPMGMSMAQVYGSMDGTTAAAGYLGAIAVPLALAFVGAWLGAPRFLAHIHGWRLLGAGIAAPVSCAALLFYGFGTAADAAPLLRMEPSLAATLLAAAGAALCLLAYWLWTLLCYAGLRRTADR